jgi:glycosyltransferase involved in cell wall biosynthesis
MSIESEVSAGEAPLIQLSLILPALNEEQNVVECLQRVVTAVEPIVDRFEVIFIDDGSTDRTAEFAEEFATGDPRVRVLRNEQNVNYGVSLARGIEAARGEWLTHNGADLPLAPEDFAPFVASFDSADAIVATRASKEAHSRWRRVTSLTNNLLLRMLFLPGCSDLNFTQFYRREPLRRLPLTSTSPAFVTPELILRSERAGHRVIELEAPFRHRTAGKAHFGKPKDIAWTLRDMLRLRVSTWLGGWGSTAK